MPKNAPSMAAATVPEYSTLMPAFSPLLIPLTTRSGRPRAELVDADFHAIGGAPLDRPTPPPAAAPAGIVVEHLFDDQRRQVRDRMPHATLLGRRGHHVNFSEPPHLAFKGRQARGVDAVVIRQ